jgi:hypothetical protein
MEQQAHVIEQRAGSRVQRKIASATEQPTRRLPPQHTMSPILPTILLPRLHQILPRPACAFTFFFVAFAAAPPGPPLAPSPAKAPCCRHPQRYSRQVKAQRQDRRGRRPLAVDGA